MNTPRLTLRALCPGDALRIAELAGDWDVARMTGRIPFPYSEHEAGSWMRALAEGEVVYAVALKTTPETLIGLTGYTHNTADGSAEIGYWIGKPYWGQGYATEAVAALMRHGFTRKGVRRFTCCHFADNHASARVVEKLGFRSLGLCTGWCEARAAELPTVTYERRRPWTSALKALAS